MARNHLGLRRNNLVNLRIETTVPIKRLLHRMVREDARRLGRQATKRHLIEQALIRDARRRYPKLAKSLLGGGR